MTGPANHANPAAMTHRLLLAPLLLVACSPAPAPEAAPQAAGAVRGPYGFDVQLTLTPRAAEKLVATQERVIVDGMYWGLPKPGVAADEIGQVPLGNDMVEAAPENAAVLVPGAAFDTQRLADIEGAPQVLVNVYSARKTHTDNLLSCGIYEGPVAMAQEKPVEIQCDLIYDENGDPIPVTP